MHRVKHGMLFILMIAILSGVISSEGYYTLGNSQTYEVRRILEIENRGGAAENFKAKILLFDRKEMPPYQKILNYAINPSQFKAKMGKDYAEFAIPVIESHQSLSVAFEYLIVNRTIEYSLVSYSGRAADTRFLSPQLGIESKAVSIVNLAKTITSGAQSNLEKAKALFDYVNSHLSYHILDEDKHSALTTLNRGYGSCVDYSLLYIALCRSIGIPARYVCGYRFGSIEIPRDERSIDHYGHAWVEVQLPRIGWVTVDPTYNYTVNGVKEVNYNFFGKIGSEDRHLFTSYSREDDYNSTWEYNPRRPAKIDYRITTTIRRIR